MIQLPPPIEIDNKTKLAEQERRKEKQKRRFVLHGYPRATALSIEEAQAYLDQEDIDCLLCGRRMKSLSAHLAKIHRISTDDYKIRFGLPFKKGLTSRKTTEKLRSVRENDTTEVLEARAKKIRQLGAASASQKNKPRTSNYKTLFSLRNASVAAPTPRKYGREDAERVLKALEAGEMLYPFLKTTGLMSTTTFKALIREYPDLAERYRLISGAARRLAMMGNNIWRNRFDPL